MLRTKFSRKGELYSISSMQNEQYVEKQGMFKKWYFKTTLRGLFSV